MLRSVVRRNAAASSFGPRHLVVLLFSSYFVKAAPATISMVEHLVNSWGLSEVVASRASKSLAHLKSTEKPDTVLNSSDFPPRYDHLYSPQPALQQCREDPHAEPPMLRSVVRRNVAVSSSFGPRRLMVLLFSSYSVKAAPTTISIAEQLVNSCGFSEAVASRTSKSLAHLKSTEKPDVILKFLISQRFHSSHLDSAVRMSSFTTAVHMGSYVLW
ncbi:hypothetical protein ZIOFF_073655 [Zingiber officinale]|uniref:Uncharacterized protein n=1 Tax=Zingiber officinale TaxID=94328 RepID=A0A8J5EAE7_ZINOF|nr:hypothetical protein ZIOFF_073655 [Zingiber officinale]